MATPKIAVTTHPIMTKSSLKQEALLFDGIMVDLQSRPEPERQASSEVRLPYFDMVEWLYREGIVLPWPELPSIHVETDEAIREAWDGAGAAQQAIRNELDRFGREGDYQTTTVRSMLDLSSNEWARADALRLRKYAGVDAAPLLYDSTGELHALEFDPNGAVGVVLRALPMPCESTPWEAIVEFRRDPEAKAKLLRLRHWINGVQHCQDSAADVVDELEYLLQEYEDHMRLHRLKTTRGTFETLITCGLEVFENLLRLRPSQAVKPLFAVRDRRLALWDAERSAPGRDVAYVLDARKALGHTDDRGAR
jgi:hypothetical protein